MSEPDPVEALAKVLHAQVGIFQWQTVALAHARGLVPEPQQYRRVADPIHVDGWNACRAETLRRLGGEGI